MSPNISIILHDSFLDAFSKLPKKIQKKTRELIKKFKENPTSSSINYEKISTFTDPSIRTVRVDLKYRAIVQAPAEGNSYHLLWVDNHDEAMDWAKNKVFEWNKSTHSFQMYDKPEPSEVEASVKQDNGLFFNFKKEQLLLIGTPETMLDVVYRTVDLNDLKNLENNLPTDNYEYLYYLAEGIPFEEILEEIEAGKNETNIEESGNAKKNIYVLTDDSEIDRILSGDFDKWKIFLHPSQRKYAYRDFKGPVKITGGAGTGKTVCAMHRALYLSNQMDVFSQPILFTTYTKSLTAYLNSTIQDLGIPSDRVHIINFDKLIFDLAKNPKNAVIPQGAGFLTDKQELEMWKEVLEFNPSTKDEVFLMAEYHDVILKRNVQSLDSYYKTSRVGRNVRIGRKEKGEIWDLVQEFKKRKEQNYSKLELCNLLSDYYLNINEKPFSHIICDEVQDFTNNELTLMRHLVTEHRNDMFLVGDPFQNIYQRKVNFSQSGINVKGQRSKKLKVNYRTTEEIKVLALKSIDKEIYDNFDGEVESSKGYVSLMHGNEPQYTVFDTPEKQEEFVVDQISKLVLSEKVMASDICICARTNVGVDEIKRFLHNNDVKYTDLSSIKQAIDTIRVSSFHNMKGHEFKFVLVVGVSQNTVPFKHAGYMAYTPTERIAYEKQERSLYYVVFSRAIQGLWITGVGDKSDWFL